MKYTLLDMVQEILSSMDSDEVNSISDTVESMQVANIIRSTFFDLSSHLDLPEHETLFELDPSLNDDLPTIMYIPDNVKTLKSVMYDNRDATTETKSFYKKVEYTDLNHMLRILTGQRNNAETIHMPFTMNGTTVELMARNDKHPSYYTLIDNDKTLLFDSYDAESDDTLQKSKTLCTGVLFPTFLLQDNFIPNLNIQQFSLLRNAALSKAFIELKQVENVSAARESRRQRVIGQYQKRRAEGIEEIFKAPRYGRR